MLSVIILLQLVRNLTLFLLGHLKSAISVGLSAERPRSLKYPGMEPAEPVPIIDMGYCYVRDTQEEYAKTVELPIQNISQTPLLVSAQSNMPSQVFLFQDKELTQAATDIRLPPNDIRTVYICLLQPNRKRLGKIYADGACREIVGGIRVKAVEIADEGMEEEIGSVVRHEETIKFVALLGKSVFSISERYINLGTVGRLGEAVSGKFYYAYSFLKNALAHTKHLTYRQLYYN